MLWHLLVLCVLLSRAAGEGLLNVALHAQSRYHQHGWVAGSEITTRGLLRAFERHPSVGQARVFAPFAYEALYDIKWDLVVIEGWIGTVPRFIHEVRRVNPAVKVVHWCLDTYPALDTIMALDVDGYITNSWTLLPELSKVAPTKHVMLAVGPDVMRPLELSSRYAHDIVYLGQASLTKRALLPLLRSVKDLGLVIYGMAWDRFNETADLVPYWRGVLPVDDIALLYSSAKVVLGVTEDAQRQLGMINNRVFEVLSCGAVLVTDSFAEVESAIGSGNAVYYDADRPQEVRGVLEGLLGDDERRGMMGREGRQQVVAHHTYAHRVEDILWHYRGIENQGGGRVNAPTVTVMYAEAESDWVWRFGIAPAKTELGRKGIYHVQLRAITDVLEMGEFMQSVCVSDRHLVLLRASWGDRYETAFRALAMAAGASACRTGVLLRTRSRMDVGLDKEELSVYDVVGHDAFDLQCGVEACSHPNSFTTFLEWDLDGVQGGSKAYAQQNMSSRPLKVMLEAGDVGFDIRHLHEECSVGQGLNDTCGGGRQMGDGRIERSLLAHLATTDTVSIGADRVAEAAAVILAASRVREEVRVHNATDELRRYLEVVQENEQTGGPRLVERLERSLSRAYTGVRARTRIRIVSQELGSRVHFSDRSQMLMAVGVEMEHFRMLADGFWCLSVNAAEVACVGDVVYHTVVDIAPFVTQDRHHESGEKSNTAVVTLQAYIRSGNLEYPEVQCASDVVHVNVYW